MENGLILLPSKGRPDNLARFFKAYKDTGATAPGIVILESHDVHNYSHVVLNPDIMPKNWQIICYEGGLGACTHFNKVFEAFPDKAWYGVMADDVVPETPGWDKELAAACLPDKVAYGDDGIDHRYAPGNDCGEQYYPTHPFIGGDLVRKWGFLVPPGFNHHGADMWWFEAAEQVVLPHLKLTHYHFSNGKAEYDATYQQRPRGEVEKEKYRLFVEQNKHFLFPRLTVACVKWGAKYSAEYVNILADMIINSAGKALRFVCYTDDTTGIAEGIETRPLPDGLEGWWNKLWLFSKEANLKGRVWYFDLDTVITGHLDDLWKYQGDFAILQDFYRVHGYGSGVMSWRGGEMQHVWESYKEAGFPVIEGGDQAWIEQVVPKADRLQVLYPGKFVSFKAQNCWDAPPPSAAVVCFHGKPDPHDVLDGWVGEIWKVGGQRVVRFHNTMNTDPSIAVEQMRQNCKLPLQWFVQSPFIQQKSLLIVGGGPSLRGKEAIIKKRQAKGHPVMAMNGTLKHLLAHGIMPDFYVMLDVRPENAAFVKDAPIGPVYLVASVCHPDVINALEGRHIVLWHPDLLQLEQATILDSHLDKPGMMVGGGSTVGLRCLNIGYLMGFRLLEIYGMDSSYTKNHHAYEQKINDADTVMSITMGDKVYHTARWMGRQAQEFQDMYRVLWKAGCSIKPHGSGLLPDLCRLMNRQITEINRRNQDDVISQAAV